MVTNEIFWLYYLEQLVILHSSNLNTYRHSFSNFATLFQLVTFAVRTSRRKRAETDKKLVNRGNNCRCNKCKCTEKGGEQLLRVRQHHRCGLSSIALVSVLPSLGSAGSPSITSISETSSSRSRSIQFFIFLSSDGEWDDRAKSSWGTLNL